MIALLQATARHLWRHYLAARATTLTQQLAEAQAVADDARTPAALFAAALRLRQVSADLVRVEFALLEAQQP